MSKQYIPDRGHIVWLDFDPQKGKEIGKYRPAFILSSKTYNQKSGLLICCPISTSIRGNRSEVPVDDLDQPSVIATNIVQTLSWKERKIKYILKARKEMLKEVLDRLLPLIGAEDYFVEKS